MEGYKEEINKSLKAVFKELPQLLDFKISDHGRLSLKILEEYSLRPGKRLRGVLAALAYDEATNSKYAAAGVRAGAAVELIQSYLLVIDDVMDQSDLRRGQPTVHRIYSEIEKINGSSHLADMKAINTGLIAQHLAAAMVSAIDERAENIQRATFFMQRNVAATVFGQLDDLYHHAENQKISEEEILNMYQLKSSFYTFINPVQIGLSLGGVDNSVFLDETERFGRAAGTAFQLSDDLLGLFGDQQKIGKSNLDDIKEGKFTLLVHYALNHASVSERRYIKSCLGDKTVSQSDLVKLRDILERCGARNYTESLASEYGNNAKKVVNSSQFWSKSTKKILTELIDYSIKREQ